MAGGSGHATHAPLSHSQTISIAHHLQDQINQVSSRLDDFLAEYSHTKEQMQAMQRELRKDLEAVHELQDDVQHANKLIDSTRKDLARTNMNAQNLAEKLNDTNRNLNSLNEAHKHSTMVIQKTTTEVNHCVNVAKNNREGLEKQVTNEITKIREDFSRMSVLVSRLREDTLVLQDSTQSLKGETSSAAIQRQNMRDDLSNSNTMVKVLEQRTSEIGKFLKATRQIVEDNSNSCTKMEDNQNKLKSEVVEVFGGLKAVNTQVRSVQECLEKTNSGLNATQGQLTHSCTRSDQMRQELDITIQNVRSLKEAHERVSNHHRDLAGQLEATRMMAQETKRTLVDTNSLVLPNLHLGDMNGLPRKPLSARGDMMASYPGSRPVNLKPLPKKVVAPGSNANMDRMAWI